MKKIIIILLLFITCKSYSQVQFFMIQKDSTVTSPYDVDAAAYFAVLASDVSVTDSQKVHIDSFFVQIKRYGLWTINQAIYLPIWNNASANKWNLKDVRDLDAAYRLTFNSITPSTGGVTGNGTSSYTDTHFTPSASFASVNDASISLYLNLHDGVHTTNQDMGAGDDGSSTNAIQIIMAYSGNTDYYRNNSSNYASASSQPDTGYVINTRSGATAWNIYRDGANEYSGTEASTGRSTYSIWLNASHLGASPVYSYKRWCFATIGTNKTATDAENEYQSVLTLLTAFGIN